MSADELAYLWSPSFSFGQRFACFVLAPATLFSIQSLTTGSLVIVFTILMTTPEYSEGPLQQMPWEEVYVILIMSANLLQVRQKSPASLVNEPCSS
jgi:hypothetical protein